MQMPIQCALITGLALASFSSLAMPAECEYALSSGVVVIGSFRGERFAEIQRLKAFLQHEGYEVLSPTGSTAINPQDEFIRLETDAPGASEAQLQKAVFKKIERSRFVAVGSLDGYVGRATGGELGLAWGKDIPILSSEPINDPNLSFMADPISRFFPHWSAYRELCRAGDANAYQKARACHALKDLEQARKHLPRPEGKTFTVPPANHQQIKMLVLDPIWFMEVLWWQRDKLLFPVAKDLGLKKVSRQALDRVRTRTAEQIVRALWPDADVAAFKQKLRGVAEESFGPELAALREGVASLSARGLRLVIPTTTPVSRIQSEIEMLGLDPGAFDIVRVNMKDVRAERFYPVLEMAFARGLKRSEILFVGNHHSDFRWANELEVPYLAFSAGMDWAGAYHAKEALDVRRQVISHPRELVKWLEMTGE